ncbi:MAG: tetratricopeptide repeat protein [Alistipes sp.]|nr:tetratricopeptide repeat protein [Alistipes senegalensis]MCM1250749.1 tetratricopeptide repeat protein [Alistipes sp.]
MKRPAAISILCAALFSTAFVAGKGSASASLPAPGHAGKGAVASEEPAWADSLRSLYLYTEGIKQHAIVGDSARARELFREAVRLDPTFAPAYYELAVGQIDSAPAEAGKMARRAHELDTANLWYRSLYGQALVYSGQYDEALGVFRDLRRADPGNPDNYRIIAVLYELQQQPFSAIATLDSAEVRFGRIPMLGAMKRQLLVSTRQFDKAIDEARAIVEAAPYEAEHHVALAGLYARTGKDSLARAEYARALEIDSTSLQTLAALSDFYNERRDFRLMLSVTRRMFALDAMPLDRKIDRFGQFTSDMRFYREYYIQLNDLASMLAIRYPRDKRVVELYARHLIASGELERALELYKLHTYDVPPEEDYFTSVIDIETYLQRPDSVNRYVDRALALFPDRPVFHIARGNALSYAKQHRPALRAYRESLRHADTDSLRGAIWGLTGDTWHQIAAGATTSAEAAERRKALKECYRAYDRSLKLLPDNPLVMNNYAYFLALEDRELEKALAMASRAVALTDNNPTYLDTYAWVLFRMGRVEEARRIMQQAIARDSRQSAELLVHYGDILDALGERFIAETYWRKALERGYDAAAIARRMEASEKR